MVIGVDSDVTDLVEMRDKDKEFKANLRYAKNIQNAILPNLDNLWEVDGVFAYHKPKDVVSGDFYWSRKKNNAHCFAVADCTGHGVSGALLTIICHQALNRCFDEFALTEPVAILNKCRQIILAMLKNGGSTISDGMDIGICCIENGKLLFSGANRPVWIIRNGTLLEYNGDRFPIGRYTSIIEDFSQTAVALEPNDLIYLFSDGITDQFGGVEDKKFSKKRLRLLLPQICDKPMIQQHAHLSRAVDNWMGTNEQLDDMCMLGIRFSAT